MEYMIHYIVLLLVSKACFSSKQTSTQDVTSNPRDTGDMTTIIANGKEHVTNNASYTSKAVLTYCSLLPENESISDEIQKALDEGITMLRFELKFILLVVLAFGETGKISLSNQLLATIAGGILPFLLKKFVFAENKQPKIDPGNDINFRVAVHDLINSYDQNWPIHDLDIIEPIVNIVKEDEVTYGSVQKETEVPKQPEGESCTVISEPPTTMNERRHHTVKMTNRDNITKVIILFKTSDIDKEDFPLLYQRMKQAKQQTEGWDIPLTVKVETV